MAACNCVALTKLVLRADPFQLTAEPLTNPLPFTVKVKAAPPAVALDGARELMEGPALLTLNAELPEVPPGAGFDTVTWAVPGVATSVAAMAACNCVALIKLVLRADPFQLTTEPLTNPLPLTVKAKAAPPAVALDGARELMEGPALLTLNAELPEVPPPGAGFDTVTWAVPGVATSVAGMAAFNCVAPTNVVVRADPFQLTTEPLTNPLPFTVKVKAAPPAVALDGAREPMEGPALLTLNAELPEVPPPGAGVDTVTWAVPGVATSVAGMAALNCVAPTNVVVRADPFQLTTELLTNPLPFTVKVKAAPPTVAVDGDRELMEGTGLLTLNAELPDVPPPGAGFDTVTWAVPVVATSVAGMAAFNCVAPTNVVVRADPFQLTTEPLTNPLPFTVKVKAAPPAVALDGARELMEGPALLTLNA